MEHKEIDYSFLESSLPTQEASYEVASGLTPPDKSASMLEKAQYARAVLRRVWLANGMSPKEVERQLDISTRKFMQRSK